MRFASRRSSVTYTAPGVMSRPARDDFTMNRGAERAVPEAQQGDEHELLELPHDCAGVCGCHKGNNV